MIKTVLTNGVFDILHVGHVRLLEFCKQHGDYLVVAIDSDVRVKKIKGNNRPVNSENDRKTILKAIRFVDEVVVFDSNESLQNIYKTVMPHILVKGSELSIEELRQKDGIPETIEILMYPFQDGYSTTQTMKRIKGLPSCEKQQESFL